MVGGAGVLFLVAADEGAVLHAGHVVDGGAVQVAAGQLLLVKLNHFARGAGLGAQGLQLLLGAVDPNDFIRFYQLDHFLDPIENSLVVGHVPIPFQSISISVNFC